MIDFYRRPAGRLAAIALSRAIRDLWPNVAGEHIVGIGYAVPFLDVFKGQAASRAALMPARQGAVAWPHGEDNCTLLADEGQLPFPNSGFDRALIVHCLEHTSQGETLLQEAWRILSPGGHIILIAPNRSGFWARSEHTPFGHGRPFSRNQLTALLDRNLYTIVECRTALHMPPPKGVGRGRAYLSLEKTGRTLWPGLGGVQIIWAEKRMRALPPGEKSVKQKAVSAAAIPA